MIVTRQVIDRFDLNRDGERVDLDVPDAAYASVELELVEGSWGSAAAALYESLSGRFDQAISGGSISSGTRIVANIDCRGRTRITLVLTTKAGSAAIARVHLVGKSEQ